MTIWQNRPDADDRLPSYSIIRTPTGKPFHATCLSEKLIGVNLHYYKRRSTPCTGDDCTVCKTGQRPRWKGYVYITGQTQNRVYIYEFTQRGFDSFDAFYTEHGTLRGARFRATRLNNKPNGPLQIDFEDGHIMSKTLPNPGKLEEALLTMWERTIINNSVKRTSEHDETLLNQKP